MICLKEANFDDVEAEYRYITGTPEDENGFCNPDAGCTREQFEKTILPAYLQMAAGIDLPQGFVPETKYFLWDDGEIVGMFKLRHYLNDALREGAGHIGYGIRRDCRGRGYATAGLRLALDKAREIVPEDEIYLEVNKDNPASIRVQEKCGAVLHHEDGEHYYMRVAK